MMFSLAIYTQVADPDLRQGRHIAGTGTINQDGTVGDIGGLTRKSSQPIKKEQKFSLPLIIQFPKKKRKPIPRPNQTMKPLKKQRNKFISKMKIVPRQNTSRRH